MFASENTRTALNILLSWCLRIDSIKIALLTYESRMLSSHLSQTYLFEAVYLGEKKIVSHFWRVPQSWGQPWGSHGSYFEI